MRKIKNFKIHLRDREIERALKTLMSVERLPEEFLQNLPEALHFYSKSIRPSILYETFPKESLNLEGKTDEKEILSKLTAKTVLFASVGKELEEEYKKNETLYGSNTQEIVSSIAVEALQQCRKFALRLINAQAQEEDNEILPAGEIASQNYEVLQKLLPIDKIDISLQNNLLIPKYSICELFYWTSLKKKGK